ncbi:hypothetical protein LP420_24880 [Massilia sp. B-10]|nr:hypothetical protein LP420_24880 [Massilia sp. B-10]
MFWVSEATGHYMTEQGLNRTLAKSAASDQWFYGFLARRQALHAGPGQGCRLERVHAVHQCARRGLPPASWAWPGWACR